MRKLLLLQLLLLLSGVIPASAQVWTIDDVPLSWSQFQQKSYTTGDAYTAYIYVKPRYKLVANDEDQSPRFTTETYINVSRSTVSKYFLETASHKEKIRLLQHEKCHIVLAHIYRKKLQQRVAQHTFYRDINKELDSIYAGILLELRDRNQVYDDRTAHGTYTAAQEIYQAALLQELTLLSAGDNVDKPLLLSLSRPVHTQYGNKEGHETGRSHIAFEDNFDDDRHGWLKDRQNDTGIFPRINGGVFEINNTRTSGNWNYSIENNVDYNRDFELRFSFMIRKSAGKWKTAGGIYWGTKDNKGFSWISISRKQIGIINCHGGDHKNDKSKHTYLYPALKENTYYTVVVRKIKNQYALFLNGELKAELPFDAPPGQGLAFAAWAGSVMVYDYMSIYYLD